MDKLTCTYGPTSRLSEWYNLVIWVIPAFVSVWKYCTITWRHFSQSHRSVCYMTSVSETIWKPPLVKAQTAFKKNKNKIKFGEKRFSIWWMEFLHPATWHDHDSWHWFRQVTAPCNVTRTSGIMTLNSPGGSILQCGRWLWYGMPWNSPKRPPYWNSTSGFDFDHITAVDMTFCTSLRNFIQIGPPSAQKNSHVDYSRWRISAILDFMGPIIGSLKSPCTTSYSSSIETIALRKSLFLHFDDRQTNRQTNRKTNRWTSH